MNAKNLKALMKKSEMKSEMSKIAEKLAFEAGLTYHPETDTEWSYIDFNDSGRDDFDGRNCIVLMNDDIITTVNDAISYSQHDCLKLLKKAIDELQNIMLEEMKMNKATKKHEIKTAGAEYEC